MLWGTDLAVNTFNINKTRKSPYCTSTAINIINNETKWAEVRNIDKSGQIRILFVWDRRGENDGLLGVVIFTGWGNSLCVCGMGGQEETGKIIKSGEWERLTRQVKKLWVRQKWVINWNWHSYISEVISSTPMMFHRCCYGHINV